MVVIVVVIVPQSDNSKPYTNPYNQGSSRCSGTTEIIKLTIQHIIRRWTMIIMNIANN